MGYLSTNRKVRVGDEIRWTGANVWMDPAGGAVEVRGRHDDGSYGVLAEFVGLTFQWRKPGGDALFMDGDVPIEIFRGKGCSCRK